MPSATRTITINRPIADVFAFLADGTTATQWRSGVLDIAHVSGEGVGATYSQGVRGPGGRRIAADYRVTASEPPTHLAFEAIAGPVRPHGDYRLEAVDGATRLTFSLDATLGFLKGLVMGAAVQRTMDAEMLATDKLKRVLEA
jgi:uncharacterized protein YndB with AHSA1/START domain